MIRPLDAVSSLAVYTLAENYRLQLFASARTVVRQ
jgi:hypothetical protein